MSTTLRTLRLARLHAANCLIEIVSIHGRKFFFHAASGRTAKLELDARNKVWLVDEYTQRRVNTHANGDWEGFSHGGTLLNLVAALRDYVVDGKLLSFHSIAPSRTDGSNYWGYEENQAIAVRAAASVLPLFAKEPAEPALA